MNLKLVVFISGLIGFITLLVVSFYQGEVLAATCGGGTCADGTSYTTICEPNCTAEPRNCYDIPACGEPKNCNVDGCPSEAHCGTPGCGVVKCAPGGNCYSDCTGCSSYSEGYYYGQGYYYSQGYYYAQPSYCVDTAPSPAPSLLSPPNGSTQVASPVTLQWSAPSSWGTNCSGNNNQYRVYTTVVPISSSCSSADTLTATVSEGTTSYPLPVSDETRVCWRVAATNGNGLETSSPVGTFRVLFHADGWYQVQDMDFYTAGSIVSQIPLQCVESPTCQSFLDLNGTGGFPGIPVYAGATPPDLGSGSVSTTGWVANTTHAADRYAYATYFSRRIPNNARFISESSITGADLVALATDPGMNYLFTPGSLTITGVTDVGDKKISLFVGGDLNIQGNVSLDDGIGFFGAFVGGNIVISADVTSLEGFFLADGQITTGSFPDPTPDSQLYVRGALIGHSGVILQRNLDPDRSTGANNETPAELIEYAPDLGMVFTEFGGGVLREGLIWREVAP